MGRKSIVEKQQKGRKMKREEENKQIEGWFKDHEAQYFSYSDNGPSMEMLVWAKPGTGVYKVAYARIYNTLFVTGDLGSAVYRWSGEISLRSISSKFSLDYFASKCEASEHGRGYTMWDPDEALQYVKEHLSEAASADDCFKCTCPPETDTCRCIEDYADKKWEEFQDESGEYAVCHKEEWLVWCRQHGNKILGNYYYEWAGSVGEKIDIRCNSHLIGLKMAMKQIKEEETAKTTT
ncbi:MAG: hypothetical protein ACTSSP_06330 [Candidatus Asgardarchaeia archaeon]